MMTQNKEIESHGANTTCLLPVSVSLLAGDRDHTATHGADSTEPRRRSISNRTADGGVLSNHRSSRGAYWWIGGCDRSETRGNVGLQHHHGVMIRAAVFFFFSSLSYGLYP